MPSSPTERFRERLREPRDAGRLRRIALDRAGPSLALSPARHGDVLRFMRLTDRTWWNGLLEEALREQGLVLAGQWSLRLTSSAGIARVSRGSVVVRISHPVVDATCRRGRWPVRLQGLECPNAPAIVQMIVEHELVHVAEYAASGCMRGHGPAFRAIAASQFAHTEITHGLATPSKEAADAGIRPNARVSFVHEGVRYRGRVVRITRRATVLTEERPSRKWYVPLGMLSPAPD